MSGTPEHAMRGLRLADALSKYYRNDDTEESLRDALADIRHACDALAFDYHGNERTAYNHYLREKSKGES